ncbi:MAG: ATP-binding protein [Treponema sp.]|nr:ATP-binding protein [Treponema sp.]
MKGSYEVVVKNRRIQYKFTINRNITILKGDSATGKTTLIEMIHEFQQNQESSGISLSCKKPCVVLDSNNWQLILQNTKESIVFIDEGNPFVTSKDFADAVKNSTNYYVIATRNNLFNLPYSIQEVYGIKNTSGNKYQETKRLYSTLYNLYSNKIRIKPKLVIVEDAKSGFEFFDFVCKRFSIPCISAKSKSKIYKVAMESKEDDILIIADGASFGPEMEEILSLKKAINIGIYLPESFEWLILKSDLLKKNEISEILENPSAYIESAEHFSWETFFTSLLVKESKNTYLEYKKSKLNPNYLQDKDFKKIFGLFADLFDVKN